MWWRRSLKWHGATQAEYSSLKTELKYRSSVNVLAILNHANNTVVVCTFVPGKTKYLQSVS